MRGLEKMTMGGEKKTMSSYRVNETKRNSTNDVKTDHDEMRSRWKDAICNDDEIYLKYGERHEKARSAALGPKAEQETGY